MTTQGVSILENIIGRRKDNNNCYPKVACVPVVFE